MPGALARWLAAAGITEGPIFRALGRDDRLERRLAPQAVCDRVQRYARLAGLKPTDFAAHSLRRGFITTTTAARKGRDLDSIAVTSRHRSLAVLRGYIERATIFERGAGEGLL